MPRRAAAGSELAHRHRGATPGGRVVRQPDPPPGQVLPASTCSPPRCSARCCCSPWRPRYPGRRRRRTAAPPERDSPGRAAATEAVLDWLSGPNPGLPDGRLLQWSGARSIETPATENAETTGDAALSVEVDAFVVVDGAGNRFTAEVQVAARRPGPVQGVVRAVADAAAGAGPGRVPARRPLAGP